MKKWHWDTETVRLSENDFRNNQPLTCPTSTVGAVLFLCMKHPGRAYSDRSGQTINENLFRLMRLMHQLIYSYRQFNIILEKHSLQKKVLLHPLNLFKHHSHKCERLQSRQLNKNLQRKIIPNLNILSKLHKNEKPKQFKNCNHPSVMNRKFNSSNSHPSR